MARYETESLGICPPESRRIVQDGSGPQKYHPPKTRGLVCKPCDLLWGPRRPWGDTPWGGTGAARGGPRRALRRRAAGRSKPFCGRYVCLMGFYTLSALAGLKTGLCGLTGAKAGAKVAPSGRGAVCRRPVGRCRSNGRPCNCPRGGRRMGPRPCLPGLAHLPRSSSGAAACAPCGGP